MNEANLIEFYGLSEERAREIATHILKTEGFVARQLMSVEDAITEVLNYTKNIPEALYAAMYMGQRIGTIKTTAVCMN